MITITVILVIVLILQHNKNKSDLEFKQNQLRQYYFDNFVKKTEFDKVVKDNQDLKDKIEDFKTTIETIEQRNKKGDRRQGDRRND